MQIQKLMFDVANILGDYYSFPIDEISFDQPDGALEQLSFICRTAIEEDPELCEDDWPINAELRECVVRNIRALLSKCTLEDFNAAVDGSGYAELISNPDNLRPILLELLLAAPQSIVTPAFGNENFLPFIEEYLKTNSQIIPCLLTDLISRFAGNAAVMADLMQLMKEYIPEEYTAKDRLLALEAIRNVMLSLPEQDNYPATLAAICKQLRSKDNWLNKWLVKSSDESFFQMVCSILDGYWEFAERSDKRKSFALWSLQPRHIIPHSDITEIQE